MNSAQIVKIILDLLGAGKLDEAAEYIADDFVCHEAASLPIGGEYHGKAGFRDLVGLLGKIWGDYGSRIHDIIGEGDLCVLIKTNWGKAADKSWEMQVLELWKTRGGKVIEVTPCYHDAGLLGKLYAAQQASR